MMPAEKQEPLICNPAMESWPCLTLPFGCSIRKIDGLNMPNLRQLDVRWNPLTDLPYHNLIGLTSLDVSRSQLQTLDLWRMPNLVNAQVSNTSTLTSIDAHDHTSLVSLEAMSCPALSQLNLLGCIALEEIFIESDSLSQAMTEQILANIFDNGLEGGSESGTLIIEGNPPLSSAGERVVDDLSNLGWVVVTD